jgi:sugar phosphate isomerase/epimerase
MNAPTVTEGMVTLPKDEFEQLLEHVAELGARRALTNVGLDGPEAARDINELRGLLDAFNQAKKTAGLTIVKMLVTGLVMALLAGAFVKLKLFGGAQ